MSRRSKAEVIEAIKSVSKSIGKRVLTQRRFFDNSDITISDVLRYFPKWSDACRNAGVEYDRSRDRIPDEDLLSDWGKMVRELGSVPRLTEYNVNGKYSRPPFDRFGKWIDVPSAFKKFATNSDEWVDVLNILEQASPKLKKKKTPNKTKAYHVSDGRHRHTKLDSRQVYGDPIDFRGLRHEPVNEQGVVFLFGMVAKDLGYLVEAIQGGFPDCEAKRQVSRGQWQTVQIEFEYASRNFADHGHDPEQCDVIICWIHNWQECPESLEVLALSEVIKKL
jgi:hypothetical protein